jgi:pantoate--beta-alanine ligase
MLGCAIVRDPDGLAMSSRNRYLAPAERERALGLSRGLRAAEAAWQRGERDAERLTAITREHVVASMDRLDYVAAVDPDTLRPPTGSGAPERLVVLIAAHLGTTRLIDNLELGAP